MQWLCNLQYEILFIVLTFQEAFGFWDGVFGFFGVFLGLAYSVEKIEIKKSEEETVEWKMMLSEIFAVLETGVSSPPHILLFGAALFSCIDLFWRYFDHIKQAWKKSSK